MYKTVLHCSLCSHLQRPTASPAAGPCVTTTTQSLTQYDDTVHDLLQVGYGLAHDLWAIAAALGDTGYGCVAVVEPQLDIDALHRQLHKARTAGVQKVCTSSHSSMNLSAMF